MSWFFEYIGSAGQINAAATQIQVVDTGEGQTAQLARAVSDIINETNSLSAYPMLHCVASGHKGLQTSIVNINVQVVPVSVAVPSLVGGTAMPVPPTKQPPSQQ